MNWLDIIILVTLAIGVIGGLIIGIVRSVVMLAGLLLGIFLAGRYYEKVGGWLDFTDSAGVANTVGFVLIVAAVMIIAFIICTIVRNLMSKNFLGCLDRILGGAVGMFFGALLWSALLALWIKYIDNDILVSGSWVAKFLAYQFPLLLALLPSSFDSIRNFFGN